MAEFFQVLYCTPKAVVIKTTAFVCLYLCKFNLRASRGAAFKLIHNTMQNTVRSSLGLKLFQLLTTVRTILGHGHRFERKQSAAMRASVKSEFYQKARRNEQKCQYGNKNKPKINFLKKVEEDRCHNSHYHQYRAQAACCFIVHSTSLILQCLLAASERA